MHLILLEELNESIGRPETNLSVSATGDDLVFLWVVAHRPEQRVGDHSIKTHKPPGGREPQDEIK